MSDDALSSSRRDAPGAEPPEPERRAVSVDVQLDSQRPLDPKAGHPGFATTAIGPGDVRDTPRIPTEQDKEPVVDPWVGRVLGNVYRVEAKIGEGGMGAVYAARHVHLGKQYAVKVLGANIASNST